MPIYKSHEQFDPFLGHPGAPQKSGPFTAPALVLKVRFGQSTPRFGTTNLQKLNGQHSAHFSPYQRKSLMSLRLAQILRIPLGNEVLQDVTFPNRDNPAVLELAATYCHAITLDAVEIMEAPIRGQVASYGERQKSNLQPIDFLVLSRSTVDHPFQLPDHYVCLGYDFIAKHFHSRITFTEKSGHREYSLCAMDKNFCADGKRVATVGNIH